MGDFTPGPWKAIDCEIYSPQLDVSLAHCFMDSHGYQSAIANARLIAAAPAMYEALKSAAGYYEMLESATGVEHDVLREIRAALALADEVNDE